MLLYSSRIGFTLVDGKFINVDLTRCFMSAGCGANRDGCFMPLKSMVIFTFRDVVNGILIGELVPHAIRSRFRVATKKGDTRFGDILTLSFCETLSRPKGNWNIRDLYFRKPSADDLLS